MKHTKVRSNGNILINNYQATRWTLVVPKILEVFFVDGVRFYRCDNGKDYDANIYDQKLCPNLSKKKAS